MDTREEVLTKLSAIKKQHEAEGFHLVGVFGSFARGESDCFSDIDVVYRIDRELFSRKYKDGFSKILKIDAIRQELAASINKKIDLISLDSDNKRFLDAIKDDILYV